MDPEHIEPATPIAGSPEVRAVVGEPVAVDAVPPAVRRPDISFAEAADAAEFG